MKSPRSAALTAVFSTLLFAGSASVLPAITVTVGPVLTVGTTTTHEWQTDYAAWVIADLTDPVLPAPVEVAHSPAAGSWVLELSFPAGFGGIQTGDTFQIQELLALTAPGEPLTGWTQTLLTAGWEWTDGSVFDDATAAPVTGLVATVSGQTVTYSFDALSPGVSLFGANTLTYTGPSGPAAPLQFEIASVPEPGSAFLGLLSGALWMARRKRAAARRV